MAQVSYGSITITDTNDIESITIQYAQNQSTSNAPETGWSTTRPTWAQGYYIWQRTVTHRSGTDTSTDIIGPAVCLTGSTGQTGNPGAAGRSLTGTETKYTNVASNTTQAQVEALAESNWISNVPSYNSSKPDYWVRIKNTYDKAPLTEYIYYKDNGITDAIKTSNDANTVAAAANSTANQANQTANSANQTATNAYNIATGINQHFWTTETDYAEGLPAGSYVTDTAIDTFKSQKTGGNLLTRSDGIWIRNGIKTLSSLTGSALTFYNPSTNSAQLIIGANGTLQSGNYTRGSDSKFSSNGTKIDLINGDIITKYFRVSQGLESGLNAGVYVHGTIEALDGTIGTDSTNYWEIGNGTDYNLSSTAKMIGHGSSYIQLGDSSTWRLATNRVHTGWYITSDSLLHYPEINSKYWDFGLHTPAAATEKFLYIRKSKANTSASNALTNLLYDIDDTYATPQWDYIFYVSADGSLYARNLYVLDENGNATQIGGTDGVYLLKSGGTMTGSITMSNGGKFIGDLTGNADTATTAGAVTNSLKIQLNSGTTEGTNQFTYNGSTAKNINITKSSIGLGNVENTALSTWAGSSSLTTAKVGTLAEAATRGVDTSISAASASTKLPTSAAVAAFVEEKGYLTSYTETDPTVPSWAKASTKPSYSLSEITGADDVKAIEALTGTSGFLKKTAANTWTLDTNTYLTSYTETDPIFVASAAHGITSSDISNWNSKTSNTGTVTSVAASGSGGITISGSPITTSGTITVGLNLSTAINGLGEGTSPATREDYIVAQYAGGGTTTTTYHRRKLSNIFAALNSSDITTALGYTPYNSTNPNGYITANHTSTYSLPIAKYNTLGGVKPAYSSTGAASLTTAAATNTSTPTIAAKTTTSGRYYAVEIDKNGILFVNVPWTNVNSSYLTSSSTLNWNNITQNKPTTANGYGITDAITNVSATSASGGSTTFTLTKSNGTTSSFDVVVYASAASQATDANYLTDGTTRYSVGSAKKPIYFDGGIPKASDGTEGTSTKPVYLSSGTITAGSTYAGGTKVTLNNSDKGASTASFYAPTSGGTSSQVLIGNGTTSAPVWTSISSLVPTNAGTADAFSSAATVALTGDTTGSASSTKGWSITTKTDRISTVGDNRAVATTPNDYVNKIIFQGLKTNSSFGTPSTDSYSYVVGLRGWSDSSGGNSHEFAFNNSGINHRSGATTSWGAWEKLVTSSNYTDYTVTKTGSGASGTWGINITGSASSATNATNATNASNLMAYAGNEVTIGSNGGAGASTNDSVWFNYRDRSDGATNNSATQITNYYFGNRKGGVNGVIVNAAIFKGALNGNADTATSATSAGKWTTARNFTIKDSDSTNSGTAVSVDGSAAVILLLPSTIKASLTGNASTATTLQTSRSIFGKSFNGGANVAGQALVYGDYTATASSRYAHGGLQIREQDLVGSAQSDILYAPTIGFHWSGRIAASLIFHSDGNFYLRKQDGVTRATLDANLNGNATTATTASKLGSSNVGAADRPIYLSTGTATQTTYRMAGTNATATTALGIDTNLDSGIWYVNGTSGIYSQSDGVAIVNKYSDSWITQIYQDYRTGQIALRGKNNGTWQAWRKVLDSSNYTSYMGNYVTLNTDQTITASQKTFTGATRWSSSANTTKYGAAHYDSTLEAIVFSFA